MSYGIVLSVKRLILLAALLLGGSPVAAEPAGLSDAPEPAAVGVVGAVAVTRQYRVLADPETGRLVRRVRVVERSGQQGAFANSGRASQGKVVQGAESGSAPPSEADRIQIEALVRHAAERQGLDPQLVFAVIRHESAFDPYAVSVKGAQGLMQLMPATAEQLGVSDVFDPAENIQGGVKHLRQLLDRYNGDVRLALAAYNAGEQAVERYGGIPPFAETRAYVQRIAGPSGRRKADPRTTPGESQQRHAKIVTSFDAEGGLIFATTPR